MGVGVPANKDFHKIDPIVCRNILEILASGKFSSFLMSGKDMFKAEVKDKKIIPIGGVIAPGKVKMEGNRRFKKGKRKRKKKKNRREKKSGRQKYRKKRKGSIYRRD